VKEGWAGGTRAIALGEPQPSQLIDGVYQGMSVAVRGNPPSLISSIGTGGCLWFASSDLGVRRTPPSLPRIESDEGGCHDRMPGLCIDPDRLCRRPPTHHLLLLRRHVGSGRQRANGGPPPRDPAASASRCRTLRLGARTMLTSGARAR